MMPAVAAGRAALIGLVALACAGFASAAGASRALRLPDVNAADSMATADAGRERDRTLRQWADGASLPELMFVLRRPPATLGAAEAPLLAAALRHAPESRPALRRRLLMRLAAADPREAARVWATLKPAVVPLPRNPEASVFRIAAVLPTEGDYTGFAADVRLGIRAGIAHGNAGAALPLDLVLVSSGDDAPGRVARAFESAAASAGAVIGGLVSGTTMTLATAAHLSGLPLVSPTAADEALGAIGPRVFQVGPSGLQRGRRLAQEMIQAGRRRIAVLTPGPIAGNPFASGFAAAAESLGARIVWSGAYTSGAADFRRDLGALRAKAVDLLFWDGEARDAATLVRQLTQERISVAICGGAELGPDRHAPETRRLLEGVVLAGEDWVLASRPQAALDSVVRAAGGERANRLHVRGYLAARLVAAAVAGGALCPEELGAALAGRVGADPFLRAHGFLEWSPEEATLPLYVVTRGRAVAR